MNRENVERAMRTILLISTTCALTTALFAQAQKPTLESGLSSAAYALSIGDGRMSGPGAAILREAIAPADFVLIGEDHLTHEIPRFAAAVCDAMGSSGGFSALALESSPAVAKVVQDSLRRPDRLQKMADFEKRYPDSAAFLNVPDENDLAAHCAAVSRQDGFEIWGLDQELIGSSGWILERMLATQPGPSARAAIVRLQAMERSDEQEARKAGDFSKLFLFAVPPAELEQATAAIRKGRHASHARDIS